MEPRIDYRRFAPDVQKALLGMEKYLSECGLDPKLMHLLKLRASQINRCAFCIDMHSKDARAIGETEQRLYELWDAWRDSPFLFRPRTRGFGVDRVHNQSLGNTRS